ncbi:nif-specific transcriptional activator NifA [Novosphingobium profundi]|nr:nif-specific transcriptional activator NifA [Novosphingobium profundi]
MNGRVTSRSSQDPARLGPSQIASRIVANTARRSGLGASLLWGCEPPGQKRARFAEREALYAITRLLVGRKSSLDGQLREVLGVLSSFIGLERPAIVLLGKDRLPTRVLTEGAQWHVAAREGGLGALPHRAITCVVAMGMPMAFADIRRNALFRVDDTAGWGPDRRPPTSWIGIPLCVEEGICGVLVASRACTPARRQADDVCFLTIVAGLLAQNLELRGGAGSSPQTGEAGKVTLHPLRGVPAMPLQPGGIEGIISVSPATRKALGLVQRAARTNSTIMLRGETGSGKEVFANCVHRQSRRAQRPFIKLNCAAVPETMLESELFGHERGAFTGAVTQRKGRFELADGGTLFLDEIGEISAAFQAKLLRVLQEREFERVGGSKTLSVDVRLVCATNRNLEQAVAEGTFRADLYYRLNVVPIFIPPLSKREGDIIPLAREFLRQFNAENDCQLQFSPGFLQSLLHRTYQGNIRELRNLVFRAATFALDGGLVDSEGGDDAPSEVGSAPQEAPVTSELSTSPESTSSMFAPDEEGAGALRTVGNDVILERDRLLAALQSAGWVQAKAARLLGITPRQVSYALQKHNIEIRKF